MAAVSAFIGCFAAGNREKVVHPWARPTLQPFCFTLNQLIKKMNFIILAFSFRKSQKDSRVEDWIR